VRIALAACFGATLVTTSASAQLPPWAGQRSRNEHQALVVLGADAQCAEVASVGGEHAQHASSLGDGRDRAVDQAEREVGELRIDVERPYDVAGLDLFERVPRSGSKISATNVRITARSARRK
jgi:hypothetical protein